jgi:RNA polymerase sigma factor (sigma-70 family)
MKGLEKNTDLIAKVADGDRDAFQEVFTRYWPQVYKRSQLLLKSHDLAQDLAQEVFIRVWEKREHLKTIDKFDSYLWTMSRNLFVDALRKKLTGNTEELTELSLLNDDGQRQFGLEYRELEERMDEAIDKLPPQMQTAFRLSRYDGLTHQEIALEMKISKITSQNYLARALLRLKSIVEKESR